MRTTISENYGLAVLTGHAAPCVWATRRMGYTVRRWETDSQDMEYVADEKQAKSYAHAKQIERSI